MKPIEFNSYTEAVQMFTHDNEVKRLQWLYQTKSYWDVMAVSRKELTHSSFLCELLKEDSFHGMGNLPLRLFANVVLKRALTQGTRLDDCKPVFFEELERSVLLQKFNPRDIVAQTEVKYRDTKDGKETSGRVDILLDCQIDPLKKEGHKRRSVDHLCFIIENKVTSGENDDQTERYYNHYNALTGYKSKDKVNDETNVRSTRRHNIYVFLTAQPNSILDKLDASPQCKCKHFVQINYQDILDMIIEPLLQEPDLSDRARFMLLEYKRALSMSFANMSEDRDGKRVVLQSGIMAIGKKEANELSRFLEKYRPLIERALKVFYKEEEQDFENGDDNSREMFTYRGQDYYRGGLVQAFISDKIESLLSEDREPDDPYCEEEIVCKIIKEYGITKKGKNEIIKKTSEINGRTTDDYFTDEVLIRETPYRIWKKWSNAFFSKIIEKIKKEAEISAPETSFMGRSDALLLHEFCQCNLKLILTALEASKMVDDSNSEELTVLIRRTRQSRDRTKYDVQLPNGTWLNSLSWGRLVLAILSDYVSENNTSSVSIAKDMNLKRNALKTYSTEKMSAYYTEEDDVLHLADGDFCVTCQWSKKELERFIDVAIMKDYVIRISE